MKRTILAILLAITPLAALAQSGTWGMRGISHDFAVANDILFSADGRGVSTYEAGATQVRRLDVVTSDYETRELAVVGSDVFVTTRGGLLRLASGSSGQLSWAGFIGANGGFEHVAADSRWVAASSGDSLRVWGRPGGDLQQVATVQTTAGIDALSFVAGRLYVAVRGVALFVYDPLTGTRVADLPLEVHDMASAGNVLWAAIGGNGIAAIDVADPAAPALLAIDSSAAVAIDGVVVAGSRLYARSAPHSVAAFDVTTPRAPRLIRVWQEPVAAIAATPQYLFLGGSMIDRQGLPTETGKPVRVFDAETLTARAEFEDLAGPVSGVATDGSLAYVVDPPYFRVLDVSSTAQPREIASIVVDDIQDSVRVKDGLAVVYGRGRVNLIDVSNPWAPKHIGTYDSTGQAPSSAAVARGVLVEGNETSGLHVVDYSNPKKPYQIAGRMWHYTDVTASDDVIYALLTDRTMLVADISNPTRIVPTSVGSHDGFQLETAPSASPSPEFLVTRSVTGFQVYRLTNPLAPTEIASIPVDEPGVMGTSESAVYFENDGELWTIDLRAPGEPMPMGYRLLSPMRIAAAGGKVLVADRYSLRIFGPDTARPQAPSPSRRRAVSP